MLYKKNCICPPIKQVFMLFEKNIVQVLKKFKYYVTTLFSPTFFDTSLPILPDVGVILFKITQPLAFYFNKRLSTEMIEIILLTLFCFVAYVSNSDWLMSWSVTFLSQIFWGSWRHKGARKKLKILIVSKMVNLLQHDANKNWKQFQTAFFKFDPVGEFSPSQNFFFQRQNSNGISKQLQKVSKLKSNMSFSFYHWKWFL